MTELTSWAEWSAILGVLGLGGALALYLYVKRQDTGTDLMRDLSEQIYAGAMAFLRREYSALAVFLLIVALLLWWAIGGATALAYVSGAVSSILAGFFGMTAATRANVRTTAAAARRCGSRSSAARSWVCRSPRSG